MGKTTFARDAGALILAAEKGYNALSGAYVQDINKWSDFKAVIRELKRPEVKEKFKVVAIDTVDILAGHCEKYILSNNGVDTLGAIPWGGGWTQLKKELESSFREITMMGYSLLFISHSKEKTLTREDQSEYMKICATPSESVNNIIKNIADIICYAHQDVETKERYLELRSLDDSVDVGSRFKYIVPRVQFTYDNLLEAVRNAIDEEEAQSGPDAVTNESVKFAETEKLDYHVLMDDFQNLVEKILNKNPESGNSITEIVERTLGKGKKFSACTPSQVEAMSIIIEDLKELAK